MQIAQPNRDGRTNTDSTSASVENWPAPTSHAPLKAMLSLPGSKSLTNRELLLSALADGPSLLRRPLHSRDTQLMVDALRLLGVQIDEVDGTGEFGSDWLVTPPHELTGSTTIACGLAGTVMRFVPPLAALALGPTSFDGDAAAQRRPMAALIDALRHLGADVADDGRGSLPFTVHGTGALQGGRVEIDASGSSQFLSAVLLVAARCETAVDVVHIGDHLPSLPHIEMTIDVLARRGVEVITVSEREWRVEPQRIAGREVDIEPDLSNAAAFLAAPLLLGGEVSIRDWPSQTTQVGGELRTLLAEFGATVELRDGVCTVSRRDGVRSGALLPAVQLDLSHAGELAPNLIALSVFSEGPSTFTGIGHLRGHETDRLAALVTEIGRLGGRATELPDGLRVEPAPLHGGVWQTYHDHRMATSGALIGLVVDDIHIENVSTTAKTLPEFTALWQQLLQLAELP